MDPGDLVLLIPVLGLALAFIAILKLPRILQRSNSQLEARLQSLEQEVGALRQELSEMQEHLDFAERVLARVEESRRLEKGS